MTKFGLGNISPVWCWDIDDHNADGRTKNLLSVKSVRLRLSNLPSMTHTFIFTRPRTPLFRSLTVFTRSFNYRIECRNG